MARIFTSSIRELYGRRIDPDFVGFNRRQSNFRYPSVPLGRLLIAPPEYGAAEPGVARENESQIRYVRITDIDEHGELLATLGATVDHVEPQYLLEDGDLLFARSGNTVGKCYIHETECVGYPCLYAGYMIRFRFDESVLPKYVFAFAQTPYYHDWVSAVRRAAGQPNINAQEYSDLKIPLPPLSIQRKIVAELDAAYAAKSKADREAAALLASIDDMVLDELGIAKLPPRDTSLAARVFTVPLKDVVERRIDAYYYKNSFKKLSQILKGCSCVLFGDLIEEIYNGVDCREYKDSGVPYLKVANIKPGEFDFDDLKYIDQDSMGEKDIALKKGRLLLTRKGTFGNAMALLSDYDYAISSEVFCLSIHTELINLEYLAIFLNSVIGQMLFDQHKIGAIMGSLSQQAVRLIPIPVPPKSVQQRIVRRAGEIKAKAKKMKATAAAQLAAAKSRIESELMEAK